LGDQLNTHMRFTSPSSYHNMEGSGNIHAVCEPKSISDRSQKLVVTVTNGSEKTVEWSKPETFQLEKKIEDQWYFHETDKKYIESDDKVLEQKASAVFEYRIGWLAKPGTYRLVYLFQGDWCSAEFVIP
jgi:hypothetical protein